jgi:hypothetical protein
MTAPACTSGYGIYYDPTQSVDTTWTGPNPPAAPVPTKLSLSVGMLIVYTDQQVNNCGGQPIPGVYGWGYQRCMTYTLLDQSQPDGHAILNSGSRYTAVETITHVSSTYPSTGEPANATVNDDGTFMDDLNLVNGKGPIPNTTKSVVQQSISIKDSTTGKSYPVRNNCLIRTAADVTVMDVTTSGDKTCKSY